MRGDYHFDGWQRNDEGNEIFLYKIFNVTALDKALHTLNQ